VNIRTGAIRTLASMLYHSRLLGPLAAAAGYARGTAAFPILAFHRVNDEQDPFFPSLPTALFAARAKHIATHYVVLPLEELAERLGRGQIPRRALALTFDDGYRDTLTHAAPILARYGLPATVFLTTGYIGTPDMPWYDSLALAVKTSSRDELRLTTASVLPLRSPNERLQALPAVLRHLKVLPDDDRRRELARVIAQLRPTGPDRPKRLMLTWDEVRALRGLGFSIGAHTIGHPILSRLALLQSRQEINGSKIAIEEALGTRVHAFAYPNGGPDDYDQTTVHLVREAGFTCAVTTRRGLNTPRTSPLELRRGGPWEQHLPTYALKLAYYHLAGV
jgi:peptidoglycan/xylan/chitin deacetylase (PgdA/CDA1 family)